MFLELRPILNTFRRAIESADTTREEIITDIRTISVVLGAVAVAVLLVAVGVIVCARSSAAQRSRMNSALMALFHETNAPRRGRAELQDLKTQQEVAMGLTHSK